MAYEFPLPRTRTTWIVVANGKRMRVFESRLSEAAVSMGGSSKHDYRILHERWTLMPRDDAEMLAEPISEYQLGHDKRGSRSGVTAAERHTVEPRLDVREEIKENFAESIASKLFEVQKNNGFDRLVLIAPQRMLGELKRHLDQSVRRLIVAEIPKDLTHAKRHDLLDYVREVLPPAPVA